MTQETATPTLEELQHQFEVAKNDKAVSPADLLKIAQELISAQKADERAQRDRERAEAKRKFDEKMAQINTPVQSLKEALNLGISETREAFVNAEVHDITIVIKGMQTEEMQLSIKPSGPGIPNAAPKTGNGASGGRGGSNLYIAPDGTEYGTRELLLGPAGEDEATFNNVGMSHRAKRYAEENNFTITKKNQS